MIFCRSCKRLSPHRSRFCGNCAKSFGARLCPKGHRNPVTAKACIECANADLSVATSYVSVRPLTLALSVLVVLFALKLAVANAAEVASLALNVLDHALCFVIGETLHSVLFRLAHLFLVAFVPFFLWWAVIERFKTPSKSIALYVKAVHILGKCAWRLLASVFIFLFVHDKDKKAKHERTERSKEGFIDGEEQ